MNDDDSFRQLVSELSSHNKVCRRNAVVKLGQLGTDEAIRKIIWVVKNKNEDLIARENAALMLGKRKSLVAVDALIEALDTPGKVSEYAAEALGKIGLSSLKVQYALVCFIKLKTTGDKAKVAARSALSKLGYQEEVEPVCIFDLV